MAGPVLWIIHEWPKKNINLVKPFSKQDLSQILNQCPLNTPIKLQEENFYGIQVFLLWVRLYFHREFFQITHTSHSEPAKIGLQLYTVREKIKDNIADTLHKIADMGFEAVETAFWPDAISVKQAGKYLKDAGLTVSSAHVELPIGDKKSAMLEIAETFNCKKMIWHGWPEDKRYSSLDGTKELVNIYNEANHFAKSNGLQFGLHNHWWEYRNKSGWKICLRSLARVGRTRYIF